MTSHASGLEQHQDEGQPAGQPVQTVNEVIVTGIRRAILAGDILPGQRLVEAELAQQFGGSRATARAASSRWRPKGSSSACTTAAPGSAWSRCRRPAS